MRTIVGSNLAAAIVIVNALPPIGGSVQTNPIEVAMLTQEDVQVITEKTFRFPADDFRGYSQGFHRTHTGVDIRSPLGSTIYAAASGVVREVEIKRFGYGHKVIITHNNGFETLYAHLDKVEVATGDTVTKQTALGTVGLTGWTTGPHLHFEMRTKNGLVNPRQILPGIEEKSL